MIEINAICQQCGQDVEVEFTRSIKYPHDLQLVIKPCRACLAEANQKGASDAEEARA